VGGGKCLANHLQCSFGVQRGLEPSFECYRHRDGDRQAGWKGEPQPSFEPLRFVSRAQLICPLLTRVACALCSGIWLRRASSSTAWCTMAHPDFLVPARCESCRPHPCLPCLSIVGSFRDALFAHVSIVCVGDLHSCMENRGARQRRIQRPYFQRISLRWASGRSCSRGRRSCHHSCRHSGRRVAMILSFLCVF
jgi:hypothetical protein